MTFLHVEGVDFELDTTAITFAPGLGNGITMNIMVTPLDDLLVEGTERYTLSISVSSGPASVGTMNAVTVNIEDSDCKYYKCEFRHMTTSFSSTCLIMIKSDSVQDSF